MHLNTMLARVGWWCFKCNQLPATLSKVVQRFQHIWDNSVWCWPPTKLRVFARSPRRICFLCLVGAPLHVHPRVHYCVRFDMRRHCNLCLGLGYCVVVPAHLYLNWFITLEKLHHRFCNVFHKTGLLTRLGSRTDSYIILTIGELIVSLSLQHTKKALLYWRRLRRIWSWSPAISPLIYAGTLCHFPGSKYCCCLPYWKFTW